MKLLKMLILWSLALSQLVLAQGRYNPAYTSLRDGKSTYYGRMTWNKKVQTGSDSLFASGKTSPVLVGASDSLYSDVYRNRGYTNMQVIISGGTTNRIVVEVLGANGSNHAATAVPDSLFKTMYWLKVGTGVTGSIISTAIDSITSAGVSAPITVPLLDSQYFKVLAYTTADQSGNPTIDIDLFMRSR